MPRHIRGYALIAAAAFCWGASAPLGRAMFTGKLVHPVSPVVLTETRNTIAALILLVVFALFRRQSLLIPRAAAWRAALLGAVALSASNYFYYLAIERTDVAIAIVVQYTAPAWVLLYLVARREQRATFARVGAVVLALLGIALVLGLGHPGAIGQLDGIGLFAALASALAFAAYNLGGRTLSTITDPLAVSFYMLTGAAAVWVCIDPPWRLWSAHYSAAEWQFFLVFSLMATLAPTLLYISGLKYLDATRAVITSCLEPVSGILLAATFLGESMGWLQALGVGCVLAAIVSTAMLATESR